MNDSFRYCAITEWVIHFPLSSVIDCALLQKSIKLHRITLCFFTFQIRRYFSPSAGVLGVIQVHHRIPALPEQSVHFAALASRCTALVGCGALKEKLSHFDLKCWVTGRTKIWYGILSSWKIFESIWLKYSPITQNPGSNFSSASDSTF